MNFNWAARSDPGLTRQHNEDSVLPESGMAGSSNHLVTAVADGMGGHAGGEVASKTAIETIAAVAGDPTIRIQAANLAVLDSASQRPRLAGMGTTLTLAIFDEDGTVVLGHVGDSRAYLLRDGALTRITADHSFVGEMVATGRMTPEEAETHPYRSVLTRAVGLEAVLDVDTYNVALTPGDRVLICSDGVTAMIDDEAILEVLLASEDPVTAAEGLVTAANAAGGADNITAVVVSTE